MSSKKELYQYCHNKKIQMTWRKQKNSDIKQLKEENTKAYTLLWVWQVSFVLTNHNNVQDT